MVEAKATGKRYKRREAAQAHSLELTMLNAYFLISYCMHYMLML